MHNAPAVGFPVGRSRFQGMLIAILSTLGVLTMFIWGWQSETLGWYPWLGLVGCLVTLFWMGWQWWHGPVGQLSWDGSEWAWTVNHQTIVVVPEVELDFQHVVLLRLCLPLNSSDSWVWIECAFCPSRWMALRRTIFDVTKQTDEPKALHIGMNNDVIRSGR